ncbi:MAG: hypothetical protein AAF985_18685 [Bacteroidota bacterium]
MKKYILGLFICTLLCSLSTTAQQSIDLFSTAQAIQVTSASSQDFLSRVTYNHTLVALNEVDFSEAKQFEFNLFGSRKRAQ